MCRGLGVKVKGWNITLTILYDLKQVIASVFINLNTSKEYLDTYSFGSFIVWTKTVQTSSFIFYRSLSYNFESCDFCVNYALKSHLKLWNTKR